MKFCRKQRWRGPLLWGLIFLCRNMQLASQQTAAPLLTENEAVSMALQSNRDVQSSALGIQRASAEIREARSNYFPQSQVNLIAGQSLEALQLKIPEGALGVYPGIGPIPNQNMELGSGSGMQMAMMATVSQPLAQLYKVHLNVKSAWVQQKIAVASDEGERQQIVSQVKAAYYQVAEAQAVVASDEEQLRWLEEALRTAHDDVQRSTALAADEMQAQASLAQQKLTMLHDENNLTTQREQLNRMLARDLDTQFTVETVNPPSSLDTDLSAVRAEALRRRPEIRQADLQVNKAKLDERIDRAGYIPDVNLSFTYIGLQNFSFLTPNSVNVGFSAQWKNPWDWGQRKADIEGLKDVTKQQRLSADDTRQKVLLDVDQRFRTLQESLVALQVAAIARDASGERLRILRNQYHEHAALLQDLLKQNADFEQRKSGYTQAVESYWSARADLERAMGEQ
jgi:outer membrane protein